MSHCATIIRCVPPPAEPLPPVKPEVLPDQLSAPVLTRAVLFLLPTHDTDADITCLEAWVGERDLWSALPDGLVVKLLVAVAARLRALQQAGDDRRVERMFTSLTGFSETRRPGFAWGLSRSHQPMRGTWASDAEDSLDVLVALIPTRPLGPEVTRRLAALAELIAERAIAPAEVRSAFDASAGREVRSLLDAGVPPHHPALLDVAGPLADWLPGAALGTVRRAVARRALCHQPPGGAGAPRGDPERAGRRAAGGEVAGDSAAGVGWEADVPAYGSTRISSTPPKSRPASP